jgi:hypothetical protein
MNQHCLLCTHADICVRRDSDIVGLYTSSFNPLEMYIVDDNSKHQHDQTNAAPPQYRRHVPAVARHRKPDLVGSSTNTEVVALTIVKLCVSSWDKLYDV